MRIFEHRFVPRVELNKELINGKRHYVLPTGEKLKSVTTVLDEKLDKTSLIEWRKRVGDVEANRVSRIASSRGTAIHKMVEKYLLNEEQTGKILPFNKEMFNSISPILDEHIGTVLGIELPLYSKIMKTAGTADLIAEFDNVVSIIDFKTSTKQKLESWIDSYFLQATVYSIMFEWIYKIKVPQIVIIIGVDHDTPQVFIKNRDDYIDRVFELFLDDNILKNLSEKSS
jgi:hypothetical protein